MKKKALYFSSKVTIGIILTLLLACTTDKEKNTLPNNSAINKTLTVNLFPEQEMVYDNTGKLSYDDAFERSKLVLKTANLIKTDSSVGRGAKTFYIYRVENGAIEKSEDIKKKIFPFQFMSEEDFFKGKNLQDSTILFLEPLLDFRFLKNNIGVKYRWIPNAPFLNTK